MAKTGSMWIGLRMKIYVVLWLLGALSTGAAMISYFTYFGADGQRLLYSTCLGGAHDEWGHRVVPDLQGNLIAVGQTAAAQFSHS